MLSSGSPAGLSIKKKLSFLFKDSVLFGGLAALSKSASLISFPFMVAHFSRAEYGEIDYFSVVSGFFVILVVLGLDSGLGRFCYDFDSQDARVELVSQCFTVQVLIAFGFCALLFVCREFMSEHLLQTESAQTLLTLVIVQVPFVVITNFAQNLMKWLFLRKQYIFLTLGVSLSTVILLVCGLIYFELRVQDVFALYLGISIIFSFLGCFFIRNWLRIPRSFLHLPQLFRFSLPVGFICLLGSMIPILDRFFIQNFLSGEDLGRSAVAAKIGLLSCLVITAFQTAWGPFAVSIYKSQDADRTYALVLKIFSCFSLMITFWLAAITEFILNVMTDGKYFNLAYIVFPLALGLNVQAVGWIVEIGISLSKRSYLSIYGYLCFLITSVAVVLLLIKDYGLFAIAFGGLAGYTAKSLIAGWLSIKAYPIRWLCGRVVSTYLVFAMMGCSLCFAAHVYLVDLSLLFALLGGLVVPFYWFFVIQKEDRFKLRSFLKYRFMEQ